MNPAFHPGVASCLRGGDKGVLSKTNLDKQAKSSVRFAEKVFAFSEDSVRYIRAGYRNRQEVNID
jgi:hypothetical protein